MKITVDRTGAHETSPPLDPPPPSDLPDKPRFPSKPPRRRKTKAAGAGVRLKRESPGPSAKWNSRPETPLLRWKLDEGNAKNNSVGEEEEDKSSGEVGRKSGRRIRPVVSARKLAAGLWRLRLPKFESNGGQRLGLQQSGGVKSGATIHCHHVDRAHSSPAKDPVHSPRSISGSKHELLYKFQPPLQFSMEGATKWDPDGWKTDEMKQVFGQPKPLDHQASATKMKQPKPLDHQARATKMISALEAELEQSRLRISELETERRSSKKKIEQFLQKLSEERAAWRSREHDKIRAIMDDMKSGLSREKKNRQRLEIINSKLVNELADAKLSAKRYLQEYQRERKARELIEEVCDELAKEIGEDKTEMESLKRESMKLREEVEEERKMLQMAEVWREERVQMKLVDTKVMLEEKYSLMNRLIENLESFMNSRSSTSDLEEIKKVEFLRQVAASINIQDIRELTYEPPNPDDIFCVFEDVNFGECNEREVHECGGDSPASHTASPDVKMFNNDGAHGRSSVWINQSGEQAEDASEWETVSHPEDQGSSYSPDGSFRVSNVSRTGAEWEKNGGDETPIMEVSEVDAVKVRQLRKVPSISRFWRSFPGNGDGYKIMALDRKNGKLSDGKLSNGAIMSPDHGSTKDGLSPQGLAGQWSLPDSGNPHITEAMKGCIEWPRSAQKSSLKARQFEARTGSQKIQLRQVLKQKI